MGRAAARMTGPALLMCVERGLLEPQAVLCVESLRRWGGALAGMPVYTFAPRPGHEPAVETVAALERLGARHVDLTLNERRPDLPHTNKVYVSAWAERELDHDVLVFNDSDTIFLDAPTELDIPSGTLAALRPVGSASAASTGPGDRNEPDWLRLYAALGVRDRPFGETVVKRTRIRTYFSAGIVAVRREAGVFGAWAEALYRLLAGEVIRPDLLRQGDQLALAGVLTDRVDELLILPDTYNYPLPKRWQLPPALARLDLPDLVHVHCHSWLHLDGFLDDIAPPFGRDNPRRRWLDERLPQEPRIEGPFRFSKERMRRGAARAARRSA
jgi:hypothetical protein